MLAIHTYPLESLVFKDDDYYDMDWWNEVLQIFQTKKVLGSVIKAGIIKGAEKHIDTFSASVMIPAFGTTWNGVNNIGSTSINSINSRYQVQTFASVGQSDGCYMNTIVPVYFVEDNTIRVEMIISSQDVGDAVFQVGLTKPAPLNGFGTDTETEYQTAVVTLAGGFEFVKVVFIFNGDDLLIGDPLTLVIFRHQADVLDTLNDDAFLNVVNIEQS